MNAVLQEIFTLKKRLESAGPEVVDKLSKEREKAESRARSANERVKELEKAAEELKLEIDRVGEEGRKVGVQK